MEIPRNISRQNILDAIKRIDQEGEIPPRSQSTTYDVLHNGHRYPPKLVVSYANKFANGEELDRNTFEGGIGTDGFKLLQERGFRIVLKNEAPQPHLSISELELKGFKGFVEQRIEFHPGLNVFIGANASGKTTILSAIAKSLYSLVKQYTVEEKVNPALKIQENDVNYSSRTCSINMDLFGFMDHNQQIHSRLEKNLNIEAKGIFSAELNPAASTIQSWISSNANDLSAFPIFKYYPANRGANNYERKDQFGIRSFQQLEIWDNIYHDSISYSKFFDWYSQYELEELRLQRDAESFEIEHPALVAVRIALQKALAMIGNDYCKIKTKTISRQGSSRPIPILILENTSSKKEEQLDNKSDGEKAIISLVADIAFNLSLATNFLYRTDILSGQGIVLIDEIETHLHPNWQRKIIPILTETFPNIQFFVATHSPQVVSTVNSKCVFHIERFNTHKVELKTFGEDSNSLLKYVFGSYSRPDPYRNLLDTFYSLMENGAPVQELEKIISKIESLENDDLSADISDIVGKLNIELSAYKYEKEHEKNR